MSKIGIIPNPASGKDIRRLVSQATVISDTEKINIVKRAIMGADSMGVEEILIPPDYNDLGLRAIEGLNHSSLSSRVTILNFEIQGNQEDSRKAAQRMREHQVDCIITLGGDGTNRVVSKACGQVPLIPLSTGTNNVFPVINEGTTAGIAAGILARKMVDERKVIMPTKKLKLLQGEKEKDIALIDSVIVNDSYVGARALWDLTNVQMVFLTVAEPGSIGMSSIGAALHPVGRQDRFGLLMELGPGGERIKAPIAPGLIAYVPVKRWRVWELEEIFPLNLSSHSVIALDGEREVEIHEDAQFELVLGMDGPKVASVEKIMREAAQSGIFRKGTRKHSATE